MNANTCGPDENRNKPHRYGPFVGGISNGTPDTGQSESDISRTEASSRRVFLQAAVLTPLSARGSGGHAADEVKPRAGNESAADRVRGMLVGSMIGDACGGPVEFRGSDELPRVTAGCRHWPEGKRLTPEVIDELAAQLPMLGYEDLRPGAEPYGQWRTRAPAGTITDDSRHKIILMRALRSLPPDQRRRISDRDIARAFLKFTPQVDTEPEPGIHLLVEEGLREYRMASRWLLGDRNEATALPVERLWGGTANCSGQMLMTPLAGLFPGDPVAAYRAAYAANFVDSPLARDFCAALIAGLAAVLQPDESTAQGPDRGFSAALRTTDPYRLKDVPFAGRPLDRWLDLAESVVERAAGSPAAAYRMLEDEGEPYYWWDAHFTLLVPLTFLRMCDFDVRAAIHLCLDFGHDTDSYAQVAGAIGGAVHGSHVFPEEMQAAVESCLQRDFGESVEDWCRTLTEASTNVD